MMLSVLLIALTLSAPVGIQRQDDSSAEIELQKGIALTRSGKFDEAIPHFVAARGRVRDDYAVRFNLALCYTATAQYPSAIELLNELRSAGHANADVLNLLTRSLFGSREPEKAMSVFEEAARLTPKNEKLYVQIAEASMDNGYYELGRHVVETGLKQLPRSARLVFESAMLLVHLDFLDEAQQELQRVSELAPGSDVAYMAATQKNLFMGEVQQALRVAREGIQKGIRHFMLLTLYGEAVLSSGAEPDSKEFSEARGALEQAVEQQPAYASAQLALGRLYLLEGRFEKAITHLEAARDLDPENPAVYSNLVRALRRNGDSARAEEMQTILSKLNQDEIERIRLAPGDRKPGYGARPRPPGE
jgi:Flp pilus assembly protein TadD, contains TPR repeats